MRRSTTWGALALLALIVPLTAESVRARRSVPVDLATVHRDSVSLTLTATGTLVPAISADVGSRVTGTLLSLSVTEGDFVRRGSRLGRIAPEGGTSLRESARAADLDAAARISAAETELRQMEQQLARAEAIARASANAPLISAQDLETARTAVALARSAVQTARAQRVSARAAAREADAADDRTVLTAPFDGIVTQVYKGPGEIVVPATYGGESGRVLTVARPEMGRVVIPVPERYALQLDPNDAVQAHLLVSPARVYRMHVRRVRPRQSAGDVGSGFEAELELELGQGPLPWGATMLTRVSVVAAMADRVVPLAALVPDPEDPSQVGLYALQGDRVRYRQVRVIQYGDTVASLDTTTPLGLQVAIPPNDGKTLLRDGVRVRQR